MKDFPEANDPFVLAWAQTLIDTMTDGGKWIIPATGARYVVRKAVKVLELENPEVLQGDTPKDDFARLWHAKNRAVFAKLGWVVLPAEENDIQ